MADNSKYIQAQKFSLAVGISTTDTSITLQSFNFPDGTAITSGDLGSVVYGTLEPGTSREEQISFTGITSNADGTVTLTGVTRGLGFGAVDTYSEQSDLKVQHGAGATFIISNTAAFYDTFVNKNNDETITGTLSVPTPTSGSHAVTKDYADGLTTATDLPYDRIIQAGTAGESLASGDLVYFDNTDNEWKKTDGTSATTLKNVLLGIAQGAGSDGGSINGGVLTYGLDSTQTGLTVGVKLYASDTAGAIAESAGTVERVIGWSKSATEIYFDANVEYTPTADEKDAMAGGAELGTPSATNQFLTENARAQVVEFTSSGSWTKDAGLQRIRVQAWGGGGGGGRGDSTNSGGGGGGAGYSEAWFEAAELNSTETVTIGSGGAGATSQGTGSNGSNTTFGSLLTAYAGSGGQGSSNPSGGNGGDIQAGGTLFRGTGTTAAGPIGNFWGGGAGGGGTSAGNGGGALFGSGGGGNATGVATGSGGTSIYGGNGGSGANDTNASDGSIPGGGGGGANDGNGGAGADGKVIVTEYYV